MLHVLWIKEKDDPVHLPRKEGSRSKQEKFKRFKKKAVTRALWKKSLLQIEGEKDARECLLEKKGLALTPEKRRRLCLGAKGGMAARSWGERGRKGRHTVFDFTERKRGKKSDRYQRGATRDLQWYLKWPSNQAKRKNEMEVTPGETNGKIPREGGAQCPLGD